MNPAARDPRANDLGLLRYLLAAVIVAHHLRVLAGTPLPVTPSHAYAAVVLFFALSGFFAVESYRRAGGAGIYVARRLARILPLYSCTVLLCAIGLAPLSGLPAAEYFGSAQFWRYLGANLCMANFLQPDLPGVFSHQTVSAVNGALWFVKTDLAFHLLVPLPALCAHGLTALLRRSRPMPPALLPAALYVLLAAACTGLSLMQTDGGGETSPQKILGYGGCLIAFLSGAGANKLLPLLTHRRAAATLCSLATAAATCTVCQELYYFLFFPSLTVLAFCLFTASGRTARLNRHNLSYALYLCHFPVIQTAVALGASPRTAALLAPPAALALAALLHYGVEAPAGRFFHSHLNPPSRL